ncbi:MAG: MFS transporter [Geodermatophilaceae bacterium]|nr:MFS transporter [Geodermatophilaceae bacterium]
MLLPRAEPVLGPGAAVVPLLADEQVRAAQRRTVWVLAAAQVAGGLGIGAAVSVGGLLALDISGSEIWAGGSTTAATLGAALLALPLAAVAARRGRRHSLSLGWALAAMGAALVVLAAMTGSYVVLLVGMLLVGSGNATNFQSRYAAADLALPTKRARDLSLVVWSTTVGTVLGPNLSEPGRIVAETLRIPPLVGPFVFAAVGMGVAAVLILTLLRPDPLLMSQRLAAAEPKAPETGTAGSSLPDDSAPASSVRATVWRNADARLGMSAIVLSHGVMVAVMTMAPVQLRHHGATLTIIGLTISLHIAGMFAFSPIFGWLADRSGRVATIVVGQALLAAAALTAGTASDSEPRLMAGLILLGLGWSAGLVAGSTLLAESVSMAMRTRVQGTSDLLMNLVGAAGGALSGVLLALVGFGGLNAVAGLLIAPTLFFAVTGRRQRRITQASFGEAG